MLSYSSQLTGEGPKVSGSLRGGLTDVLCRLARETSGVLEVGGRRKKLLEKPICYAMFSRFKLAPYDI